MGPKCHFPFVSSSGFCLLFICCQLLQIALSCIGFGGCGLYGYPATYRCAPAYYSAYYPTAGGCYGAYCRDRLRGSRILALNESGTSGEAGGRRREEEEEGQNADEKEEGEEAERGRGKANNEYRRKQQNHEDADGFGQIQIVPDAFFLECCKSWSLPPECLVKCSFTNYSADTLRSMFLRSDGCPIESASVIHFCASQNQDHRPCCLRAGIDQTKAGQKCLIFCDQMPQNETRLDLSYLPCLEHFSEMKKCFYENALRTIDYLEADLDEIRKEEEGGGGGEGREEEEADKENAEGGGGKKEATAFSTIGRSPIIFVNDLRPKHPRIRDDYFVDLDTEDEADLEGNEKGKRTEDFRA